MRVLICVFSLLSACATHTPKCDGRLQPINLPAAGAGKAAVIGSAP
jgi:hypothetical protein